MDIDFDIINGRLVTRECIDLHSTSYMRSMAINAAAAPTTAKAPLFWLCAITATEVPVLFAGVAAVVVPVPKLVAVLAVLVVA
ncbi:hypothetical protein V8E54_003262 [Elaphomyces granulatus]|jgi:hypothetical protein